MTCLLKDILLCLSEILVLVITNIGELHPDQQTNLAHATAMEMFDVFVNNPFEPVANFSISQLQTVWTTTEAVIHVSQETAAPNRELVIKVQLPTGLYVAE